MSSKPASSLMLLPRFVRLRDAPAYLGMDRNRFNREVRPTLTEIRMGEQGIAFDRLELDAWADDYKACNGRPARYQGDNTWDTNTCRDSSVGRGSGTSTKPSAGSVFAKAVAHATKERQNAS